MDRRWRGGWTAAIVVIAVAVAAASLWSPWHQWRDADDPVVKGMNVVLDGLAVFAHEPTRPPDPAQQIERVDRGIDHTGPWVPIALALVALAGVIAVPVRRLDIRIWLQASALALIVLTTGYGFLRATVIAHGLTITESLAAETRFLIANLVAVVASIISLILGAQLGGGQRRPVVAPPGWPQQVP
jgi:hypothetical protein